MSEDTFTLPDEEIAGQAGRAPRDDHPFTAGQLAAAGGRGVDSSQWVPGSWQYKRFVEGHKQQQAEIEKAGVAPREDNAEQPEAKKKMGKRLKLPSAGLQEELIPDARQKKGPLPKELKKLLAPLSEAIYNAALHKQQENEYKDQAHEIMAKHDITEVELPNGGKLLYKPGKATVQYIAPKNTSKNGDGAEPEAEE
jgi:hypothetical protein